MNHQSERTIRIGVHNHTHASDGKYSLEDMVKAAIGKYDLFCMTDHVWQPGRWEHDLRQIINMFNRSQNYLESVAGQITIIPGVEISRPQWHVLLLGVDYQKLMRHLSEPKTKPFKLPNLLTWAEDQGVLAIAAHPLHKMFSRINLPASMSLRQLEKYHHYFAGAEIHNGAYKRFFSDKVYRKWQLHADKVIHDLGLHPFVGADAHSIHHLGMGTAVTIDANVSMADVLGAIKLGRNFTQFGLA